MWIQMIEYSNCLGSTLLYLVFFVCSFCALFQHLYISLSEIQIKREEEIAKNPLSLVSWKCSLSVYFTFIGVSSVWGFIFCPITPFVSSVYHHTPSTVHRRSVASNWPNQPTVCDRTPSTVHRRIMASNWLNQPSWQEFTTDKSASW